MPTEDVHAGFVATARRLINRHGRKVQLMVPTKSGPAHRQTTVFTPVDIVAVVTSFSLNEIDGSLVQARDKRMLVDADRLITVDMRIKDGPTSYEIKNVGELQPGTRLILYQLQVRA